MVLMSVLTPAITAMPPLLALATIVHRLAGGGAEQEGGDAVDAGIDRAGEHRVLAVGRALERDHLDRVAGRDELLVEIDRDAVDELERSDPQDLVLGLVLRLDRRGAGDRQRCNHDGQRKSDQPGKMSEHGNPL